MFGAPSRRGVTFFSDKKESNQRKLSWERVGAERSDGPSLRWALGTWMCGRLALSKTGWLYPSFTKSFTLGLIWVIWVACAVRVAARCW